MVAIGIGSMLLGAVLGVRLPVLVLLPVIFIGLIIIAAITALNGLAAPVLTAAIYVVVLQLGYLGGLFVRFALAASRIRTHRVVRSSVVRG
jgi:hydrogenase/urease accessory protein HupE